MISVVIPTKNRESKLKKLILSLVVQHYNKEQFEVIIINDGSRYSIDFKQYIKNVDLNIQYYEIEASGPAAARNFGVLKSSGDIIAFIDDDCVAKENWLTNINNFFVLDSNKNVIAIGGGVKPLSTNSNLINNYLTFINFLDGPIYNNGKITNMTTANLTVKRNAFNSVKGFDERLRFSEDENLVWKLSNIGELAFDYNNDVLHDHDITFKQFCQKYMCYGSGIKMHCELSGEILESDGIYSLFCRSKADLFKNFNILYLKAKKRVKNNNKWSELSLYRKCKYLFLSIVQEMCIQIGGIKKRGETKSI